MNATADFLRKAADMLDRKRVPVHGRKIAWMDDQGECRVTTREEYVDYLSGRSKSAI